MKNTKITHEGKSRQYRKHPIGRRMIVGLLCICLSLVSLPIDHFGYLLLASQEQEIVMFSALPEEVREQTVQMGTELEELDLPDALEAVCRPLEESLSLEESSEPEGFETSGMPETSEPEGIDYSAITEGVEISGMPEGIGLTGEIGAAGFVDEGAGLEGVVLSEEGVILSEAGIVPEQRESEPEAPEENLESSDLEDVTDSTEENINATQTETVIIEGVSWISEPEYDSETEGSYVFMPVLPESYSPAADMELPEIVVSVVPDEQTEETGNPNQDKKESKLNKIKAEESVKFFAEEGVAPLAAEPGCGTISEDTVWTGNVTLADGELVVDSQATLTIMGVVTIQGDVTIRGGGKIVRGSGSAYFKAWDGVHLTVKDITLDGAGLSASNSMIEAVKSDIILDDGCRIQNCIKTGLTPSVECDFGDGVKRTSSGGGSAFFLQSGTAIFNDIVLENNSISSHGAATFIRNSELWVNGGVYRNNKITSSTWGGSCLYNVCSKFYIYGGKFIGNSSNGKGGSILICPYNGSEIYLYGGYFEGNTCSNSDYPGSGAVYYPAYDPVYPSINGEGALLELSGNIQFCGDGTQGSGVDGVYLEINPANSLSRKVQISDTLRYPVTLYLRASEGYVIAEGTNEYRLLHERDMKKLNFVDIGGSGKTWYAVLDKEKNQVYLSENKPDYGYYVYYISNGAEGTVVDNANGGKGYQIGDTVTVQSADGLKREGYTFLRWNTKADDSGERYEPGAPLTIEGDTNLYAIFVKGKTLSADFYSGSAGQTERISEALHESEESVTITAPQLADMEGWNPMGWNADPAGYTGDIAPEDEITLSEDKEFYGVYEKDVVLSYKAENADIAPEDAVGKKHANVHDEVSTSPAQFEVAPAAVRYGFAFAGWNTRADGKGTMYKEGDFLETETDMALYAVFKRPLFATFYSGGAGQKEVMVVEIPEDAVSGSMKAPELKELELPEGTEGLGKTGNKEGSGVQKAQAAEGWEPVGWDLDPEKYEGKIKPEEDITLMDDTSYYGVYRKGVTLTYEAKGMENFPNEEQGACHASVHEGLTISPAKFTVIQEPERAGYAFTGWNTKADGSGENYHEADILELEEDTTLYAVFKKSLAVNFYSGSQGKIDSRELSITWDAVSAELEMPEPEEMEGWTGMGWSTDISGYQSKIQTGTVQCLTEDTDYYGIYEKDVTLSYEGEGVNDTGETKLCRANVHGSITYDKPMFTLSPAPVREGYIFQGWSTQPDDSAKADGSAVLYPAGSRQEFDRDTTLYASWKADIVPYRVEHYLQETKGDGYALEEADTEELSGTVGEMVAARPREYKGFTENTEHALRRASGKVEADGSLILKFFYDRNLYHVDFDINGGAGKTPEPQTVRYGGLLQTVDAPERKGYNFKGWYPDKAGSRGKQWHFARTVEKNTSSESVTLYAKWADETAPILEKASYEKGHKDLFHWILRKDRLKITVPITEEGSGVKQAEYVLIPEKAVKGEKTTQGVNICAPVYGAIGLPLGAVNAGGKISRTRKGRARVTTKDGKTVAEFTISEDFKGTVAMTGSDWAGNVSAEKILTAEGGGVIVEDNAPDIRFVRNNKGQYDNAVEMGVDIKDNADGNITGGIAGVSYQIDDGKEISLPEKEFNRKMVGSYWFTVKVSGAGSHSLRVKAIDNAGNSSEREIAVDICGEDTPPAPEPRTGSEPKTGDGSHVEIYATVSMIAGFSYLLLYFKEHGMKEEEKEELVSRLVGWAKGKGGIRRMAVLVLIFFVLAYYHSIGKNVDGEWGEVVRSGQ